MQLTLLDPGLSHDAYSLDATGCRNLAGRQESFHSGQLATTLLRSPGEMTDTL